MAVPTGSIIRMPKVENALGQSTTSAASQKAVTDGIDQAKSAASTADGKAVTAQNTATAAQTAASGAKTAADNAQKTANEAKTAASTAQTAANNANSNANGRVPSGRKINGMDLTADRNITAEQVGAYSKSETYSRSEMDARYQPKGQSGGITLGAVESGMGGNYGEVTHGGNAVTSAFTRVPIPDNAVVTKIIENYSMQLRYYWRRITGGI